MSDKKRNNARKSAARAVQKETGLRYKKALAMVADRPPTRVITAPGIGARNGSLLVSGLVFTVQDAEETLKIAAPKPVGHPPMSDWWPFPPKLGCHNRAASWVLLDLAGELSHWQPAAGVAPWLIPEDQPVRFEVPVNKTLKSSPTRWLAESLAAQDRDRPWVLDLLGHLTALRQQLMPFHGAPVDDVRAVVDHLQRWLAGPSVR